MAQNRGENAGADSDVPFETAPISNASRSRRARTAAIGAADCNRRRSRSVTAGLAILFSFAVQVCDRACAASDAAIIAGFHRVVFGSEFQQGSSPVGVVKKFTTPIRFYIEDRSRSAQARAETETFLKSLPEQIRGLASSIVGEPATANFRVLLVKRQDYVQAAGEISARDPTGRVPGECLVRIVASSSGIIRSDAVIATDAADGLFRKCLIAEVLQGLGPINDDVRLRESAFNDRTRVRTFTAFDKAILNALYDPRIRAGMQPRDVDTVLPAIVRALRLGSPS